MVWDISGPGFLSHPAAGVGSFCREGEERLTPQAAVPHVPTDKWWLLPKEGVVPFSPFPAACSYNTFPSSAHPGVLDQKTNLAGNEKFHLPDLASHGTRWMVLLAARESVGRSDAPNDISVNLSQLKASGASAISGDRGVYQMRVTKILLTKTVCIVQGHNLAYCAQEEVPFQLEIWGQFSEFLFTPAWLQTQQKKYFMIKLVKIIPYCVAISLYKLHTRVEQAVFFVRILK